MKIPWYFSRSFHAGGLLRFEIKRKNHSPVFHARIGAGLHIYHSPRDSNAVLVPGSESVRAVKKLERCRCFGDFVEISSRKSLWLRIELPKSTWNTIGFVLGGWRWIRCNESLNTCKRHKVLLSDKQAIPNRSVVIVGLIQTFGKSVNLTIPFRIGKAEVPKKTTKQIKVGLELFELKLSTRENALCVIKF